MTPEAKHRMTEMVVDYMVDVKGSVPSDDFNAVDMREAMFYAYRKGLQRAVGIAVAEIDIDLFIADMNREIETTTA
jgi:hypothetical protein